MEFPKSWPEFALQIKEFLEIEDFKSLEAALISLKYVCKVFEFEFDSGRDTLNDIADNLFPIIEVLY